jgi:hypothetical protein
MSEARARNDATTSVLLKTSSSLAWPEQEDVFYLLSCDGLFRCRNHEFFRSCVRAETGPSDLGEQRPFLAPRFPMIPQALIEEAVGFFDRVAEQHGSEATVVLAYDREDQSVHLVVPVQTATVSYGWSGYVSPIGVHYVPPTDLPASWVPYGDIHSHVDYAAYSSTTDVEDETHAAGLHVVIGRIREEPPEIHVEAVVDGTRFTLESSRVIEGYEKRRHDTPDEWLDRVKVASVAPVYSTGSAGAAGSVS